MKGQDGKSNQRPFLKLLEVATSSLRRARRNRHSLGGTGYYAKAYWRSMGELKREGALVAQELEKNDRVEQAKLLRVALEQANPLDGSFVEAESQLNRVRTLWYSAIEHNIQIGRAQPRIPKKYLTPELRENIPGPLRSVFDQIQGCYAFEFWDAALVMVRKLVESLIIEGYEIAKKDHEIKANGNYIAFGDLVGKAKSGVLFRLSRDSKGAIDTVKALGDNAAHNPRFTGRRSDLDGLRNGARILTEDLARNIETFRRAASQTG